MKNKLKGVFPSRWLTKPWSNVVFVENGTHQESMTGKTRRTANAAGFILIEMRRPKPRNRFWMTYFTVTEKYMLNDTVCDYEYASGFIKRSTLSAIRRGDTCPLEQSLHQLLEPKSERFLILCSWAEQKELDAFVHATGDNRSSFSRKATLAALNDPELMKYYIQPD